MLLNKTEIAYFAMLFTIGIAVMFPSSGQETNDAAAIQYKGVDIRPYLDFGLLFDSNLTRKPNNEISTWSQLVSPKLGIRTNIGASQFDFDYRLRNERFFSSQIDNYSDHFIAVKSDAELNLRNRVVASYAFEDGHESRGTGYSIGNADNLSKPDQYKRHELDFSYTYGASSATGLLEIKANYYDLDFDINTPLYRARDRDVQSLGASLFYRVAARIDATFDISHRDINYDFALTDTLDSTDNSYLLGLRWETTDQTSGYAKIGFQSRRFKSDLRQDTDGIDWEAGVIYQPRSYTSIELRTIDETNETNGEGDFIVARSYSLLWNYAWLARLKTSATISFVNSLYESQFTDSLEKRSDNNRRFRAGANYQFRRWLNVELFYQFDQRDSNRVGIDFDRNQIALRASLTL